MKLTKMHGLGNDFILFADPKGTEKDYTDLAIRLCDRRTGIGADGLAILVPSKTCDVRMRIINSDGSEAEMCGNGIRCVGKFVYDKGLTNKTTVTIETLAGIKTLKFNLKDKKVETVRVDMGEPILNPEMIPVISSENPVKDLELKALDKEFIFTCVSMGNPHAITVVKDIEKFDVETYGRILEVDKAFPNKTNVEFVQIVDKEHIKMRVWERGAGETLACGTGACATAVACHLNGLTDRNVYVELLRRNIKNRME